MAASSQFKSAWSEKITDLVLTLLLMIAPAAAVVTYRYLLLPYSITAWIQFVWIFGMILGAAVGWYRFFPRWVYPYILTLAVILIGFSIGRDTDMTWQENLQFKLIVLAPAALLVLILWLFFRKYHPPALFII